MVTIYNADTPHARAITDRTSIYVWKQHAHWGMYRIRITAYLQLHRRGRNKTPINKTCRCDLIRYIRLVDATQLGSYALCLPKATINYTSASDDISEVPRDTTAALRERTRRYIKSVFPGKPLNLAAVARCGCSKSIGF